MKHHTRHKWIYKIVLILVAPFFRWRMGYRCLPADKLEEPYIVLANHTTDLDPVLVAMSFTQQMYFVASEHIYRWGFVSKLLSWCFAPIARAKGSTDARTVMDILGRLHAGYNVCIFAEGNRSFNGLTTEILPSTGKLVKATGAMLVTYKLEGGYFASPRWSRSMRRGKMFGHVAGKYSASQLKNMTNEEISALIERDLFEDAYARQTANPVRYRGKHLAEHLETALYLCPRCKRIGTLHSKNDRLTCGCGLLAQYSEFGELKGECLPFKTVTEWDQWQSAQLLKISDDIDEDPICSDTEQNLYRVQAASGRILLVRDSLMLFRDRLVCGAHVFPVSKISNMAIYGAMSLIFTTTDGGYYEIISDHPRSATKYLTLFRAYKQKQLS